MREEASRAVARGEGRGWLEVREEAGRVVARGEGGAKHRNRIECYFGLNTVLVKLWLGNPSLLHLNVYTCSYSPSVI